MKSFSNRDQSQWGIPNEFISPLGWKTAIFELSGLEHNLTPSMQLLVLTRTCKAIYSEFKHAVIPLLQQEYETKHATSIPMPPMPNFCIAADDLVPIFLFILCQTHTKLRHPLQNRDLMWSLCHPDQLHGESGYYLTVYESALEFILQEPNDRMSFQHASHHHNSSMNNMNSPSSPNQAVTMSRLSLTSGIYNTNASMSSLPPEIRYSAPAPATGNNDIRLSTTSSTGSSVDGGSSNGRVSSGRFSQQHNNPGHNNHSLWSRSQNTIAFLGETILRPRRDINMRESFV